jgi:hypothetical protein
MEAKPLQVTAANQLQMEDLDLFWKCIAKEIEREDKIGKGHPREWKRKDINLFLGYFHRKLLSRAKQDEQIAARLKIPYKNEKFEYGGLSVIGYDAFRRTFITREGQGSQQTQDQFAIYFGHASAEEYLQKHILQKLTLPPIPSYLPAPDPPAPYLGLQTFKVEDARLFHGRDRELLELVHYLQEMGPPCEDQPDFKDLILLVGQTGVGKSSFLQAGLFPRLFEEWDIFYGRRALDEDLTSMFLSALQEKPRVVLIDRVESILSDTPENLKLVLEAFFSQLGSLWSQVVPDNFHLILAVDPEHLPHFEQLINSLETRSNPGIIIEHHLPELIPFLKSTDRGIVITPSLGVRHNLWKALSLELGGERQLIYRTIGSQDDFAGIFGQVLSKKRKIIILDQLEEAITRPNPKLMPEDSLDGESLEISHLLESMRQHLEKYHDCKIILSFRADYLAPIEDYLDNILPNQYKKFLLKPLDKQGVKNAIEGPLKDNYFQLKYYDDFVSDLIHVLKEDDDANIAPALQILLKNLWEASREDRFISKELFRDLVSRKGAVVEHFVKEQLEKVYQHFKDKRYEND